MTPGRPDQLVGVDCDATPGPATPVVTAAVARASVVRLLPRPAVGVAPVDHVTLVNIDTLFWLPTGRDVDLGTVTLLGQRVTLRAHLAGVQWSFGDGVTADTPGPGTAYPQGGPCSTAHCPAYFSHDYTRTGQMRVSATATWAGQFRVGDGGWQDIAQTVPVTSAPVTLRVRQARAVLVPNP